MIPFIHIGPLTFGTYGIMLATGLFAGFVLLRAELFAAGFPPTPSVYLAHPILLVSPTGFTFYGAVIGGLVAAALLAHHYRIPFLTFLDVVASGAALG